MIKTVSLTADTETKVEISGGYNVGVINRTTGMLYASRKSGIVAGADDVAAIPAGDSYTIRAADDTVYLLATAAGDVQLESIGAKEVFKIAATCSSSGGGEGGGTVDEVARQAISSHANNADIHYTDEKAITAAGTTLTNPGLLINSDFRINQRGQTEYTDNGYTVDGWYNGNGAVSVGTEYITISKRDPSGAAELVQKLELPYSALAGKTVTISAILSDGTKISATGTIPETQPSATTQFVYGENFAIRFLWSANGYYFFSIFRHVNIDEPLSVKKVKLELGTISTIENDVCDKATELAKCQRYFYAIPFGTERFIGSGVNGDGHIVLSLPTTMRITPTISNSDGSETKLIIINGNTAISDVTITQVYRGENNISVMINSAGITGSQILCGYHQRADDNSALAMYLSAEL